MTPLEKIELAARILDRGKMLAPDRFPKADSAVSEEWALTMSAHFDALPVSIWPEAIRLWALHLAGERMATPRDIKDAAYVVRDRWESDPAKRPILQQAREQRRELRDRQLAQLAQAKLRELDTSQRNVSAPPRASRGTFDTGGHLGTAGSAMGSLGL